MRSLLLRTTLLATLSLAGSAEARRKAPASALPRLSTVQAQLKPGTWVRYSMFNRRNGSVVLVRLAALDRVGSAQWFEVSLTSGGGKTLVLKSLVEGALAKPKRVLKAIIQPPGQAPLLIPPKLIKKQLPGYAKGTPGQLVGSVRIKVAAGVFAAKHYRRVEKGEIQQLWSSTKVPGWPLVKVVTPRMQMELASYGKGAQSEVNGTPLKMNPRLLKGLGLSP